jgi:hypothetical protein
MNENIITFEDLHKTSGMKLTELSKYFEIPYRTIQDWHLGNRKCPDYIIKLMTYKLEKENMMKAKRPAKRSADHLRFYKTANCLGQGMIIVYDTEKHKSTFIDCDDIAEGYDLIATTAIYMQDSRLFDSLDDIDDDTTPTLDTSGMKDVTKDVISELNKIYSELNKI